MCDAVQGEHIARAVRCLRVRARTGAETLEGLFGPVTRFAGWIGSGQARADRNSETPAVLVLVTGTAKRVGGARAKTRARPRPGSPRRVKPKGASSGRRAKHRPVARDSRKGQNPEAAARWAGPSLRRRDYRREKRQVGAPPRKRGGYLPRGESSEGRIP